jgi:phosphotransferase system enzyme I (PtsI)
VALGANIGSPAEVHGAIAGGAEGIGLFRTEFLFLNRDTAPSEEEQYAAYREALAAMAPGRVVIRTADMGGDKEAPFLRLQPEPNPALGLRGIRLSLRREDFFRSQVRALLRSSRSGNLAILLPMISCISEVRSARVIMNEIAREIRGKGEEIAELIPVGVMIETPAAALTADALAREADFLSLGTNDLTQYVLAVDRLNEQVSYLYQPLHPAVLRLMHDTAQAAARNGKPLSVCGELAGDPGAASVFIGLGVTELSMSPERIAPVRGAIGRISRQEAVASLQEALASKDSRELAERLSR